MLLHPLLAACPRRRLARSRCRALRADNVHARLKQEVLNENVPNFLSYAFQQL